MKPDDPNFPEEIPPIPAPREEQDRTPVVESSANSGDESSRTDDRDERVAPQGTDTTTTGNRANLDVSADVSSAPGIAFEDSDETFDSDDIDYDQTLEGLYGEPVAPAVNSPRDVRPVPSRPPAMQPGAADRRQREAETPVTAREPSDDWGQSAVPYQPKELGIIDQLLLLLADGAAAWRKGLRWVRAKLPPTWQHRLSDEVMTAISLGLLVLLVALWQPLGGGKATEPVAQDPAPQPVVESPGPASETSGFETETPELAPAPGLASLPDETPEQGLIADIQDKVSDISRTYAAGLIQSVEVNLPENRLIVNLGENWYGLLDGQQDDVSQSIFEQVQQLDFKTLQLRDPGGVVVARNPVVGNTMVILHRSRSAEADLLIS